MMKQFIHGADALKHNQINRNRMQRTGADTAATRRVVTAAMFAALILLATSVLKIQTPAFGYIHIGEAFVLLAGLLLGPAYGGLAAGIGSGLADFLGGYAIWAPGTFLIKFLTAAAASLLFRAHSARKTKKPDGHAKSPAAGSFAILVSGLAGEAVMTAGYFFYNVLIIALTAEGFTKAGIASACSVSAAEIPFNIVQGTAGILLAVLMYPVFSGILRSGHYSNSN